MSTALIIWVIVAVVAVAVLAVVVWLSSRRSGRRAEADRARAAELRREADAHRADLESSQEQARRAATEAEQAEAQAQQARARAVEAERGAALDEAHYEDRLRDADRLDPEADTQVDAGDEPAKAEVPGQTVSVEDRGGPAHRA